MNIKLSWGYRCRAWVRLSFPRLVGFRRFLRNRGWRHQHGGFLEGLTAAIKGKAFFSQEGEDRAIYEAFFANTAPRRGYYIELGALDGIRYSNTKFFEDYLGWRGMLIEPVPEQFAKLQCNRPGNVLVCAAVSQTDGDIKFRGNAATAGMAHTMSDAFLKRWHSTDEPVYLVKSMPFSRILEQYRVHAVDLLSIDVEGGEFEVLNTFDWSIPVHIIAIELDGYNVVKDEACRTLLKAHGFRLLKRLIRSEIWHHPGYAVAQPGD